MESSHARGNNFGEELGNEITCNAEPDDCRTSSDDSLDDDSDFSALDGNVDLKVSFIVTVPVVLFFGFFHGIYAG